jgi:ligand-binding SRPBCC domain-containing protein
VKFDSAIHKSRPRPRKVCFYERSVCIDQSPSVVFDFCLNGENFAQIFPTRITAAKDTDSLIGRPHHVYPFRIWVGPIPLRWEAHIVEYNQGHSFADEMLAGPLRYWRHTHICEPDRYGTRYTDSVYYRTYLPTFVDQTWGLNKLTQIFSYRHARMKELLEAG